MSDQIQRFFDELKTIRYISRDIGDLADSFLETGNPIMAKILRNKANLLLDSHDKLRNIHGEMIHDGLKIAQENTNNIISAVFAGKTLVERSKNHKGK